MARHASNRRRRPATRCGFTLTEVLVVVSVVVVLAAVTLPVARQLRRGERRWRPFEVYTNGASDCQGVRRGGAPVATDLPGPHPLNAHGETSSSRRGGAALSG